MGEGNTPLIAVRLAGRDVRAKLEYASPTLSFKDRGAVFLVAAAVDLGAQRVVADSSGNAGVAIAAYAARAGLPCTVFVPAATAPMKVEAMRALGATVKTVDGSRERVATVAAAHVEDSGAFYASHVWNPWFFEGTKAYAHELWAQCGRRLPETIVLPAGNGTLVLGVWRGVQELLGAGDIDHAPRLVAVQAAACAPIAIAFTAGLDTVGPVTPRPTVAEGVAIAAPVRGGEILAAVRASGGSVETVTEEDIVSARRELAAQGLWVEPTAAVAAAAVAQLDGELVILLAGSGPKGAG
jgi:threonine synthase